MFAKRWGGWWEYIHKVGWVWTAYMLSQGVAVNCLGDCYCVMKPMTAYELRTLPRVGVPVCCLLFLLYLSLSCFSC